HVGGDLGFHRLFQLVAVEQSRGHGASLLLSAGRPGANASATAGACRTTRVATAWTKKTSPPSSSSSATQRGPAGTTSATNWRGPGFRRKLSSRHVSTAGSS